MADLDQMFARLDLLDPPDVSEEIERRVTAPSPAIPPPPNRRRLAAGLVAAAIVTAVAVLAWIVLSPVSEREHEPPPATMANWQDVETGWTRLADLPTPLQGSVRVWADGSLIVWGGNEGDGAGQSSQGWRLDRVDGSWRTIAPSPLSPRSWAAAAWTGSELLIWGGASGTDPMSYPLADGAAYDPATDSWRSLAPAPLTARSPLASVWTGTHWLVWGDGPSRTTASAMDGVVYDPTTDTWTPVPTAPLRINDGHAVWAGTEMVVFGAELLGGNHAQTEFAVGEAFDPASGTWRALPPSHLDPQATAVTWDGQQVVAADYLGKVQAYDPIANAWGDLPDPPLDTGEDSPQLAVADGRAIEHLFGGTALLSADHGRWTDISTSGDDGGLAMLSAGRFAVAFSAADRGRVSIYLPPPDEAPRVGAWQELPLAEEVRDGGSVEVWAGDRLLARGGPAPGSEVPSSDWFAYDPSAGVWTPTAPAPFARSFPISVWTGSEALFWGGYDETRNHRDGMAYDPQNDTWRTIPEAPLDTDHPAVSVWTGEELILWGGGRPGEPSNHTGAAYDPSTDSWRRIADAPVELNASGGAWSGRAMYVFGSNLNGRNVADVQGIVTARYDPLSDTWTELPTAPLSPQASAGGWVDGRLVVYDYNSDATAFDPSTGDWRHLPDAPFAPSECYPDAVVSGQLLVAWYCGELATFDPRTDAWTSVPGGISQAQIAPPAYGGALYQLWRFASLDEGDGVVYFDAEGLTVEEQGGVCYGCAGAPRSLWAYRPPG
jgi:N-acetylneuraminic acid mutarotase